MDDSGVVAPLDAISLGCAALDSGLVAVADSGVVWPCGCGQPVPEPAQLPPAGSGPLVYAFGLCFSTQGNRSAVEPETHLYYLRLRPSRPSQRE